MKKVNIRRALGIGWSRFKARPWFLLGVSLAVAGLFILAGPNNAAVTALAYILYGGYIAVLLRHYHDQPIVFDDLFTLDQRWVSFAFLALIKGVLIFFGLMLFIVPGIYLAIRWMFAELFVIEKGMRPIEALRASSELTKGVKWKLLLFTLVSGLLMTLGAFALLIGAMVAAVVVLFAAIKIYYDLQEPVSEE